LRVKTFERETDAGMAFPGGWHYHRRKEFVRDVLTNRSKIDPYVFHMSWTKNKDNKRKFYQQLGEWYVRPQCEDKTVEEIGELGGKSSSTWCCSAEALVTCHYRDKPSIVPCRDSPPIDKGRPSFW